MSDITKMPKILISKENNLISFMFNSFEERAYFLSRYVPAKGWRTARFSDDGKNVTWVISEIEDFIIGPELGIWIT